MEQYIIDCDELNNTCDVVLVSSCLCGYHFDQLLYCKINLTVLQKFGISIIFYNHEDTLHLLQIERLICHLCTSIESKLMRCFQLAPCEKDETNDAQKVSPNNLVVLLQMLETLI